MATRESGNAAKPKKPRPRKLAAKPGASPWLTSLETALQQAKESGKLVLANFSNSDFCPWSKKLKAEILGTPAFKAWASGKLVLAELDYLTPQVATDETTGHEKGLMKRYRVTGLPTILFLNPRGTKVGKIGYLPGGPDVWLPKADRILKKAAK